MGDPRKLGKKYSRPTKVWDKQRIMEEGKLLREYGLKNMRELWRAVERLRKIRRQARDLQAVGAEGAEGMAPFMGKLQRLGIVKGEASLDAVLGLTVRDVLDRRLQTLVYKKGLARTINQSRQFIVHGFIGIDGQKVSSPNYIVPVEKETKLHYTKKIDLEAGIMKKEEKEPAKPGPKVEKEPEKVIEALAEGEGETKAGEEATEAAGEEATEAVAEEEAEEPEVESEPAVEGENN